ncbi:MAG TPA: PEGA domain-containing protein [Polyangiaceae bacterium]
MDQEPPRLKHQGGWLAAAIDTLQRELPSEGQLEQLQINVCSGLDPDEFGSGVRERLRKTSTVVGVGRTKRPRPQRVRRSAPGPSATEPSKPSAQPSWHTVACAAVAGALLTLAASSAWHGVPRPTNHGGVSTAAVAESEAPILREIVEWPSPASAPGRAATPSTPNPRTIPSVTLESALGPALPEVWEAPGDKNQRLAYRDGDLWWLHPEAAGGGRLKLNSNPISKVSVDGTVLGLTPIVDAWVPAGKHTVTFDHPIFGRKRRVVEVMPGATELVAVWFGNEPQR